MEFLRRLHFVKVALQRNPRSSCGWASGGNGLQQAFDVSAAEFWKVIIIIPDLIERDVFDLKCDDFITVTANKALRPKMRDRHGCNDPRCAEMSDGLNSTEHG